MAFEDSDFEELGFFTRLVKAVVTAAQSLQLRIRSGVKDQRLHISAEIKESDIIIEGKVRS